MKWRRLFFRALMIFALSIPALADLSQSSAIPDTSPLQVQNVVFNPKTPKPGQIVEVQIHFNVAAGYHAYVNQFRLALKEHSNWHLSKLQVQPTFSFADPLTHKNKIGVVGNAQIISLLDLPQNLPGGALPLNFQLTYQACGQKFCLFPKTVPIKAQLEIQGAQNTLTRALAKGWFYALIVVFFAGILTSFTPCIFPMIPITLAVLGTKDHDKQHGKGFLISASYVFGIAIMYSILGVIAAKTGAMFGSLLGRPLVVGVIAGLFVLMGLSMYGLFELQLPVGFSNKLTGTKQKKGMIGAFASGLVAGVVASPCVGPVLISILAYVAQKQNPVAGFFLLFTFALGFGQLFLVIGTFQTLWQKMPRSGPWMEQVKIFFGTLMIAMAFYYIKPVTNHILFNGLVATALFAIAIYFGAFSRTPENLRGHKGHLIQRITMRILFALGLVFAAKTIMPTWLVAHNVNPATGTVAVSTKGPSWATYSKALLKHAAQVHRPVIVDFGADWCLACAELDKYTFSNSSVLKTGHTFLWLRFDATSPSAKLSRLQKRYKITGLPTVLFFGKKGQWERNLTLTGYENAPSFLKRMRSALNQKTAAVSN